MKIKIQILLSALLITLMQAIPARAGWPVGKRHYVISTTISFYKADKGWNNAGKLENIDGNFQAQSLGIFAAYGLSRGLDLIATLPASYQTTTNQFGTFHQSGAGDLQLGLSGVLKHFNYANYITLYVGGVAPLYKNTNTKVFGLGNTGIVARLSNSGPLGKKTYYNVDLGGGQYFGNNAPRQLTWDGLLGFKLDDANQLNFSYGGIYSQSDDKGLTLNAFAARNYAYQRATAGFGHTFSKRFTMNLSGFYIFTGRNTGQGYGASLSASMKLPYYGKHHADYLR